MAFVRSLPVSAPRRHRPRRERSELGTWWSNASSAVKRSVFVDDLVYSIATDRVKVQRLDRFGEDVADLPLLP